MLSIDRLKAFQIRLEWRVAIKTAIAGALGWLLGSHLSLFMDRPDTLVSGLWTTMTAIIVLQAHLGGTYQAALYRLLGVFVGSVMGGICTTLLGSNPISLGISIFATIIICSSFNIKESVRIASLSVTVVMVLWGLNHSVSPWTFAFFRFLDSAIGVAVALVVAHAIWPFQATYQLRQNSANMLSYMVQLYGLIMDVSIDQQGFYKEWVNIMDEVKRLKNENLLILQEARMELLAYPERIDDWVALNELLDKVSGAIRALKRVHEYPWKIVDEGLNIQLGKAKHTIEKSIQKLSHELSTGKFEGHLNELEDMQNQLKEDLTRFRSTKTTRKFNLQEVESFYVFFYSLNRLIDQLQEVSKKLEVLFNKK